MLKRTQVAVVSTALMLAVVLATAFLLGQLAAPSGKQTQTQPSSQPTTSPGSQPQVATDGLGLMDQQLAALEGYLSSENSQFDFGMADILGNWG